MAQFSCERDFQFLKNFVLAHFLNDTNFLLAHFPSQWLGENGMTHTLYESLDFHPIIDSENVPKLNLYHSKNVPKQNFWEIENLSHKKTVPKRNTSCNWKDEKERNGLSAYSISVQFWITTPRNPQILNFVDVWLVGSQKPFIPSNSSDV